VRAALACLAAGTVLTAACWKRSADAPNAVAFAASTPSPAAAATTAPAEPRAGAAVAGVYTVDGKPAALTQVTAHPHEPFDGRAVTELVFSAKDQAGDPQAATNALFGGFGDAIIVRVWPDGTVIGADLVHSALKDRNVSVSGALTTSSFSTAGGEISGRLTSSGPTDLFGQKLNIDLKFHTKSP
jgi:hypothetical protein